MSTEELAAFGWRIQHDLNVSVPVCDRFALHGCGPDDNHRGRQEWV